MADTSTTVQKVAAEVIGTFVLVFIGCSAAISTGADVPATGLAFGITVLAGAYAFGRISGAHFNPAVTVGAALGGRMAWRQVPTYIGAQLAGALVAGLTLFVMVHGIDGYSISDSGLAQNHYGDQSPANFSWWAAFLLETVMTAIFLYVILAVTDGRFEHPALAPAAIGLTLSMLHFASINLTGTSVNPARSIGVALFAGSDAIIQLWLFILAPLLGGAIAGVTYAMVFGQGTEPVVGSGWAFVRRPVPAAVPGYGAPDQFQEEWNRQALEQAAWEQEPIIQDGWQWDHAAQEWKPLEQWQQPAAPPAHSAYPTSSTPSAPSAPSAPATPSTPSAAAAPAAPSTHEPTQVVPRTPDPGPDPAPPADQPPPPQPPQ